MEAAPARDPRGAGPSEGVFVLALVGVLVLIQSVGIGRPFLRQHESVGTEFSKHARNHLKFGLARTRGLRLDVSGPSLEAYSDYRRYFYPDHPPLPALILAGVYSIFGSREVVYRTTLIVFSVLSVLLFRRIARRLLPDPYDRAASAGFALLPMFAYYSVVTCLQVTALTGILAGFLSYLRWREGGGRWNYLGLLGSNLFACLCAWPGYYLALVLLVAHPRKGGQGFWKVALLLPFNLCLFGLYLGWLATVDPSGLDPLRHLLRAALSRSSLQGPSLPRWIWGEGREIALMFTVPAVLLTGVGMARGFRQSPPESFRPVAALALLGLDEILFAQAAACHEYYSYYLAPFLALSAGQGLAFLSSRLRTGRIIVLGGAAVFFAAQSAWVLNNRLRREGGYEFYQKLGLSLSEATEPRDRILLLTDDLRFYTPYYGDRYVLWYDRRHRRLQEEYSGDPVEGVDGPALRDFIAGHAGSFQYVVTADPEGIRRNVGFLSSASGEVLRSFGVVEDEKDFLRSLCGPPRERRGFLFWRLPRSP